MTKDSTMNTEELEEMKIALDALLFAHEHGGYSDVAEALERHEKAIRKCRGYIGRELKKAKGDK